MGTWGAIHLGFILYTFCVVMPNERKKMIRLTPQELLETMNEVADGEKKEAQGKYVRENTDGTNFFAVYGTENACKKGEKLDKKAVRHHIRRANSREEGGRETSDADKYKSFAFKDTVSSGGACLMPAPTVLSTQSSKCGGSKWWATGDDADEDVASASGVLPEEELLQFWPQIHAKLDVDNSGAVDKGEIAAAASLYTPIRMWLQDSVDGPDLNRDGTLILTPAVYGAGACMCVRARA